MVPPKGREYPVHTAGRWSLLIRPTFREGITVCHFTPAFWHESAHVARLLGVGTKCTNRWKTAAMTLIPAPRALQGTYPVPRGYSQVQIRSTSPWAFASSRSLRANHPTKTAPQPFSVVCSAEYLVHDSVLILLSHLHPGTLFTTLPLLSLEIQLLMDATVK